MALDYLSYLSIRCDFQFSLPFMLVSRILRLPDADLVRKLDLGQPLILTEFLNGVFSVFHPAHPLPFSVDVY